MRYVRIDDGTVAEVIVLPDDREPADVFHPDIAATIVPSDIAEERWILEGGLLVPPPGPAAHPVDLVAYAANRRWLAEQTGTNWNSWPVHTDDRSQGKYLSELQAIALGVRVDGDPWKFADGLFRPVSNADFPQLAIAARNHVRTVFGIEAGVLGQIEIGTITTAAEIDAAFS